MQPPTQAPPHPAALPTALTAGLALLLAAAAGSLSAQARSAIDTRQRGLVCDQAAQLCYNREGISLSATRSSFGRFAEEKARRLIARGERGRTFLLSNGVACDVQARTCWDDGWKRRNVANSLTSHLFGSGGTASWGDSGSAGNYSADCLLRRAGRVLYDGSCELRESNGDGYGRFSAILRNGGRYTFRNDRGRWWISDSSGGRWPVAINDYGRAAVFRWADMSLETRQRNYRGGDGRNRSIDDTLRDLFN
jgi:hypothetical protein